MSTEAFTKLQLIHKELAEYLYTLNENIDWNSFLNTYITLAPEKLLKRIKSLIWIDKDIDTTNKSINNTYFEYYTSLINKFIIPLRTHTIYILSSNSNSDTNAYTNIPEEFKIELDTKISVLHRLLNIYNIKYVDINSTNSINNEIKILITTCSITYPSNILNKLCFESNEKPKLLIPDDFNNIYTNDNELILNHVKLAIKALCETSLSETEILNISYGFLKLK